MADLPGREDPAYEAAKQRAAELATVFAGHQVMTEAELATRGIHPVSIAHGSAETSHDADLTFEVMPRLARNRLRRAPVIPPESPRLGGGAAEAGR